MTRWMTGAFLTIAVSFALACGPIVMIPGGKLDGSVSPSPKDWSFTDDFDTVQLETNPQDPYSVNLWSIGIADTLYVAAGDKESTWAKNIEANPDVRLRAGSKIYELRATPTDSKADRDAFLAAIKKKYDADLGEEDEDNAQLFKLSPR